MAEAIPIGANTSLSNLANKPAARVNLLGSGGTTGYLLGWSGSDWTALSALSDSGGSASIDWNSRQLIAPDGICVDWTGTQNVNAAVSFDSGGNSYLYGGLTLGGGLTLPVTAGAAPTAATATIGPFPYPPTVGGTLTVDGVAFTVSLDPATSETFSLDSSGAGTAAGFGWDYSQTTYIVATGTATDGNSYSDTITGQFDPTVFPVTSNDGQLTINPDQTLEWNPPAGQTWETASVGVAFGWAISGPATSSSLSADSGNADYADIAVSVMSADLSGLATASQSGASVALTQSTPGSVGNTAITGTGDFSSTAFAGGTDSTPATAPTTVGVSFFNAAYAAIPPNPWIGGIYFDGTNWYRSSDGLTWSIF